MHPYRGLPVPKVAYTLVQRATRVYMGLRAATRVYTHLLRAMHAYLGLPVTKGLTRAYKELCAPI